MSWAGIAGKEVVGGLLGMGAAWLLSVAVAGGAEASAGHKTDWLYHARWGIMYHLGGDKAPGKWDASLNKINVELLAKQFSDVGAGYFLVTALHGRYPLAPNEAYDKKYPGEAPKRDLILELATALAKHDIHLMLYVSTGMKHPPSEENATFHAGVIREFSLRYKRRVKGWWFDNNAIGRTDLQQLIVNAARAGNPDTLVAFSPPKMPVRATPFDDFTAGNTHAPGYARCHGRFVDGAQWHMLSFLGNTWAGGRNQNPRWPAGKVMAFTHRFISRGGVITWDVPYNRDGSIAEPMVPLLKQIGETAAKIERPKPGAK